MANVQPPDGGDDRQRPSATRFAPSTGVNPTAQRSGPAQRSARGGALPLLSRTGGGMTSWLLPLAAALVLLLCLCGGITWLVNNANNTSATPTAGIVFGGGAGTPISGTTGLQFGPLQTASAISAEHRATVVTSTFTTTSTIYVVFPVSNVASGTNLYAQWIHDGQVYDNSTPLIAQQPYKNTYVEFHMQPIPGKPPFPPGNYTVQIYVNGNPGPRTNFVVR